MGDGRGLIRRWPGLAVAIAVVATTPAPAAPADLADARSAYAAGRHEEARARYAPLAKAGDPQAQLALAMLYDVGQGGARDAAAAYGWYRHAAEAGLPEAEFNVAVMADNGDGVARDPVEAATWYARAAAHGNRRAQYNLAQLYLAGEGVPRNRDQAEEWFRAAAPSLPAAVDKLADLRRSNRRPASGARATPLLPAQLVSPKDVTALPGPRTPVELVWTAPEQASAVRFFVQVMALDGSAAMREEFATELDETAVLASLGPAPGRYAWRVYSIARDGRHYAASEWARFEVGSADVSNRSRLLK